MWDVLARIIQFILRALSGSAADELAVREAEKVGAATREVQGAQAGAEAAWRANKARQDADRRSAGDRDFPGSLPDDSYRRD